MDAPSLTAVLGTFAVDAGIAWMVGCIAVVLWSSGRPSAWATAMRARHAHALTLAGGWTAAALVFDLWRRSAAAADVSLSAAGEATATMLVSTHYGRAWTFAIGAVVVVTATAAITRRRTLGPGRLVRSSWITCIVVLAYARAVVSHAGGHGDLSLAVAGDVVHGVSVALWAGVVWASAFVGSWSEIDDAAEDERDAASWLRTLSLVATVALTAIMLSGITNTWHATAGSLVTLWGSLYGFVLAAKVALVLVAAALGAVNRWIFLPRLLAPARSAASAARRSFMNVLRFEAAVLAAVSLLAAGLGNLEPPGSM